MIARKMRKSCVIGTSDATKTLTTAMAIEVGVDNGAVTILSD